MRNKEKHALYYRLNPNIFFKKMFGFFLALEGAPTVIKG
jgi:hypothetical protein